MSPRKIILPAVGISLIGAGAYLAYLYVNRDREDEDQGSEKQKTYEVEVPNDAVAAIVGRGGCVIKELQETSGCRIRFADAKPGTEVRTLTIRGQDLKCQLAKLLIEEILETQAKIATEEIFIPSVACGRVIGRCGENIQKINLASNAKIDIEQKSSTDQRLVKIRGTPEQRAVAKTLIEECVAEDAEIRKNLALRQPRGPPKADSPAKEVPALVMPIRERFIDKGQVDGQIEVYVSAVEDPGKFWVQIVGPKATELDQLVDRMTEYYNVESNKLKHQLESVQIGDLVAAQFAFDQKWYRSEVTKVTDDVLELYFVDYGDTTSVEKKNAFELRTDYLLLRFQAIECFLASVEPTNAKWTNDAIGAFEELTHVAQWKKLWSKVVQYKERESGRGRREGSPVPGVHLFDNAEDVEVNLSDEMIKRGHAKSDVPSRNQSPRVTPIPKESPRVTPIPKESPRVTPIPKESPSVTPVQKNVTPVLSPNVIDLSSDEEELTESSNKVLSPISTPRGESPRLIVTDTESNSVDVTSPDESSFDLSFSTPMNKTNNNSTLVETNGNDSSTLSFLDNERGAGDATPVKKQLFDPNKF